MIDFRARWSHPRRPVVFFFPRVHYTSIARALAHVRSPLSAFETSLTSICVVSSVFLIRTSFLMSASAIRAVQLRLGGQHYLLQLCSFEHLTLLQNLWPHVSVMLPRQTVGKSSLSCFSFFQFPVIESSFPTKAFFMPGVYFLSCLCSAAVKFVRYF